MRHARYVLAPLGVASALGLGGLVWRDSLARVEPNEEAKQTESLAVEVTRLQRRTIQEKADLVGSLEAGAQVEVRARIDGYIRRLPLDVGDLVEIGQVLVELDNSEQKELVIRAEAARKVAQAQLQARQAQVLQAERELAKHMQLSQSRVSTKEQVELAESQLAIARAELELEQAHLEEAESDLLRSRLALEEMRILAPMTGFVAERFVEVGDLAGPSTPLLRIVNLDTVRTLVHVIERDYERVVSGQAATISVDAFPSRTFTGAVVRKAPVLDPYTRTAAVQIEIPNTDALLKPGMHGRVSLVFCTRTNAEVVPLASLVDYHKKPALYVVSGDPPQTRLLEVQTGIIDGEVVEIIGGLSPEDCVVTLGSRLVHPGQLVTPMETDGPTPIGTDPLVEGLATLDGAAAE